LSGRTKFFKGFRIRLNFTQFFFIDQLEIHAVFVTPTLQLIDATIRLYFLPLHDLAARIDLHPISMQYCVSALLAGNCKFGLQTAGMVIKPRMHHPLFRPLA
jgi:hypothetical protein